ncbi:hypothetical protein YC2023_090411 [Brassica napus]
MNLHHHLLIYDSVYTGGSSRSLPFPDIRLSSSSNRRRSLSGQQCRSNIL